MSTRLLRILLVPCVLAVVIVTTGCDGGTSSASRSPSTTGESHSTEPTRVIHLVAVTEGRAPDPGEAAANPWKYRTESEWWIAEGGERWRQNVLSYSTTTQVKGADRQVRAVRDGVQYILMADSTHDGSMPTTFTTLLESDALRRGGSPSWARESPPMNGDPSFYRRALRSGEATVVGEGSVEGTKTLSLTMLRLRPEGSRGTSVTVEVRADDYMPVTMLEESWADDGLGMPKGRHVYVRCFTRYTAAEVVAGKDLREGALELDVPADVTRSVNRHLRPNEARRLREPRVYWVGERFKGFKPEAPSLSTRHPRRSIPVNVAEMSRRLAGRVETEVVVRYAGSDGTDLRVWSLSPDRDIGSRELRTRPSARLVDIGGRQATVFRGYEPSAYGIDAGAPPTTTASGRTTFTHVVIDMPGATVRLQGWFATEGDVIEAAKRLRPYGE